MTEKTVAEKITISPNVKGMVKTKGGGFHKDDFVGSELAGLSIDQVKFIADELGIDANKYDHLNVGQQRMNIGNRLRGLTARNEGQNDEVKAYVKEARETISLIALGFRETNEATAYVIAVNKSAKGLKAPEPIE